MVIHRLAAIMSTFACFMGSSSLAVEGMWQPEQLPLIQSDLKKTGLKLDPGSLSDLGAFPMTAMVSLGGCSASFVSPEGLVVTNHHCAYGSIQYNSSQQSNLLGDGFVAASRSAELPAAPGTRVFVTEAISDVTQDLLGGLGKLRALARHKAIEKRRKVLIAKCEAEDGYRCRIDSFLGSSSYRLTKQLEIKDVRLVQAPPAMIGKYGGDIDNWMWPRHTGDFAFYRAYVSKTGKPASYSEENVPFKPRGYLKIDTKGVSEGSFVMVAGYPGRTNRHRLASEVDYTFNTYYTKIKAHMDSRISLIEKAGKERPELLITYAGMLAGMKNYSKNIQGKQEGYEALDLLARKQKQELIMLKAWQAKGLQGALKNFRQLDELIAASNAAGDLNLRLRKASGSQLLMAAKKIYRWSVEQKKPDAQREPGYQERDLERVKARLKAMDRRFDSKMDQELWALGLGELRLEGDQLPKAYRGLVESVSKAGAKSLSSYYQKSQLGDGKRRLALLAKSPKDLEKLADPFMKLAIAVFQEELALEQEAKGRSGEFQRLRSQYMLNFRDYVESQGEVLYPDANSTLRISYGTVQSYKDRAGTSHPAFTKLEEVAKKHTGEEPFDAPKKQLALIKQQAYGPYKLASLGTVPVNFLADLDITGGNSGSATLNDKGELTGLVFDGTIDGVISDWAFDPQYTRSIHVDVRYMLWVLDKFYGAKSLLREMGVSPSATTH